MGPHDSDGPSQSSVGEHGGAPSGGSSYTSAAPPTIRRRNSAPTVSEGNDCELRERQSRHDGYGHDNLDERIYHIARQAAKDFHNESLAPFLARAFGEIHSRLSALEESGAQHRAQNIGGNTYNGGTHYHYGSPSSAAPTGRGTSADGEQSKLVEEPLAQLLKTLTSKPEQRQQIVKEHQQNLFDVGDQYLHSRAEHDARRHDAAHSEREDSGVRSLEENLSPRSRDGMVDDNESVSSYAASVDSNTNRAITGYHPPAPTAPYNQYLDHEIQTLLQAVQHEREKLQNTGLQPHQNIQQSSDNSRNDALLLAAGMVLFLMSPPLGAAVLLALCGAKALEVGLGLKKDGNNQLNYNDHVVQQRTLAMCNNLEDRLRNMQHNLQQGNTIHAPATPPASPRGDRVRGI